MSDKDFYKENMLVLFHQGKNLLYRIINIWCHLNSNCSLGHKFSIKRQIQSMSGNLFYKLNMF